MGLRDAHSRIDTLTAALYRLSQDVSELRENVVTREMVSVMLEERGTEVLEKVRIGSVGKTQEKVVPPEQHVPATPPLPQYMAQGSDHTALLSIPPANTVFGNVVQSVSQDEPPQSKSEGRTQSLGYVSSRQQLQTGWDLPPQNVVKKSKDEFRNEFRVEEVEEKEAKDAEDDHGLDVFQPEYEFKESVWDLIVFMGFKEMGMFGTFLTVVACILNGFLQASFCIVIYMNFRDNNFDQDSMDGLNFFRLHTAHDAQYSDSLSAYTLAQGICNEQKSFNWRSNRMLFATAQLNTLNTIDSYLSDQGGWVENWFNGRKMCYLAMCVWCLSGLSEIRSICHFTNAVFVIPRSYITKILRRDEELIWIWISHLQFAMCVMIIIARLAICTVLMYCGFVWLSYTDDAASLLLNAVALSFVVNCDELLFDALAPLPCKKLVSIVKPIRERRWIQFQGVDLVSLTMWVSLPLVTLCFLYLVVDGMIEDMKRARSALCDGNREFSFSTDAMGMAWVQTWHSKSAYPFLGNMDIATRKSTIQRLHGNDPYLMNPTLVGQSNPLQISQLSFANLVPFANRGCRDIIEFARHPDWKYHNFLREFFRPVLPLSHSPHSRLGAMFGLSAVNLVVADALMPKSPQAVLIMVVASVAITQKTSQIGYTTCLAQTLQLQI